MMKTKIASFMLILCVVQTACAVAFKPSKWDMGQKEIHKDVTIIPGKNPIPYKGISVRERQLYGYDPRYIPAAVTFDLDNRPYMIFGDFEDYYAKSEWPDVYIQTLDDEGSWITCNLNDIFKAKFPQVGDTKFYSGTHLPEKIAFDRSGGMYFFATAQATSKSYLFYSTDNLNKISVYDVSGYGILEHYDSFQSVEKLKVAGFDTKEQKATVSFIEHVDSRRLKITEPLRISETKSTYLPQHSGAGNSFVTIGDITHIAYIDMSEATPREFGTKQSYVSYNHKTNKFSEPRLLGFTTSPNLTPDSHNGPAITVDSDGVLHIVLGSHGRAHKYTYSKDNGRTWSGAEDIESKYGGSYVALVTDKDDTMHFVSRLNGGELPLIYTLHHIRKEKGKPWQDMGRIILPDRLGYNIFYHNLTIDRKGRLFLSYSYYAAWLSDQEKQEYKNKWPSNPDPDEKLYAHDPVIIMSEDGITWKLATTKNFSDGIKTNTK
jgi:hypothetical protein